MPYTEKEQVKKHVLDYRVGQAEITGLSIVLAGTDIVQLPHAALVESSVVVKARESSTPAADDITATDEWIALAHGDVFAGSVVVADHTSLGTIYIENIDYTIDAAGGRFRRITGGAISAGQPVVVWYFFYRRYQAGVDYALNAAAGQLQRLGGGDIEDGQSVLVDYVAGFGTITDEAIEQAIAEADQAILQLIAAEYRNSTDPGLVAAETHWAVANLCRMRAAVELSGPTLKTTAAASAARAWLDLAEQYALSAQGLLTPFLGAHPARRFPTFVARR
jgi:hypothetical protein